MTPTWRCSWKLKLVSLLAMGAAIATSFDCVLAQVTPDGTLGAESSVVTPANVNGLPSDQIDGGATRGANLFHSFEQFSIPTGGEAFFNNALDIQNVISRVTGSSISNIDGLIRANGTANLFLLNPNGIIFGSNASLNIGGSFVGSTASSLNFADGTQFNATAPQTTPLLTVSVPIGLQYAGTTGSILNQSQATNSSGEVVGLSVLPGETLALLGGDVRLDGGNLQAPGGRVELGGLAGAGTVGLSVDSNNLLVSFSDSVARADVSLTNGAGVDVAAGGGGSIAVNPQNLNLVEGSILLAGIASGLGSVASVAGDVQINATGVINLDAESLIVNAVLPGAVGKGGNINVTTGSLSATNGAALVSSTFGQGDAGSVNINARDAVSFSGVGNYGFFSGAGVLSYVGSGGVGNGGNLNLTAGSLSVTDGAQVSASTFGLGNAGNLNVLTVESVELIGTSPDGQFSSGLRSAVEAGAVGNGGNLTFETGRLLVRDGAQVSTATFGLGNAGDLNVRALETVELSGTSADGQFGSGLRSAVEEGAVGNGGNLNFETGRLLVRDGAQVSTATRGTGDAGNLNVLTVESVELIGTSADGQFGSGLRSAVEEGAVGNGGNLNFETGSLSVTDGAQVSAGTFGQGDAGSVFIQASDTVSFVGDSGVFNSVGAGAVGNGGNVNITAGSLSFKDGAGLSAYTLGQGNAGTVFIQARDTVSFDGVGSNGLPSGVLSSVESEAVGNSGDITVESGSISLTNGAQLRAGTFGRGDAGNVTIRGADAISFDGVGSNGLPSGVLSSVESGAVGKGGNITVESGSISLTNGAQLRAGTFGQGDAGNVTIRGADVISFDGVGSNGLPSGVLSSVESGAVGNSGNIAVESGSISLTNGAQVSAAVRSETGAIPGGRGSGGSIRVDSNAVNLVGIGSDGSSSGLFTSTGRGAIGPAGDIAVNTNAFRIADGAIVTAQTLNPSNGGRVTINSKTFEAANGGQVLTTTRSGGNAGNITLNVADNITLSGSDPTNASRLAQFGRDIVTNEGPASGLFASTDANSTGNGGNIFIDPVQLTITNGANVSVSSLGTGNAGSIEVSANSIRLDNQGQLTAETASGSGGNITLRVQDLLRMRNNSLISAEARGTGNSGNININTDFLIAVPTENSDIIASALRGGNIEIAASGIFGVQFRESLTPESDITASGTVTFNTPDVDPSQGLLILPAEVVDVSNQIAQGCPSGVFTGESKFIITGRGGLPPNPREPLNGDNVLTEWNTLDSDVENRSGAAPSSINSTKESANTQIVEANGWTINDKGDVVLTASAPSATLDIPWVPKSGCNAPEPSS